MSTDGPERDRITLTPRARRAAGPIAWALVIVLLAFYFAAQFDLAFQRGAVTLGAAVLIALGPLPAVAAWSSIRYRLTDRRLLARRGILRVRRAELVFVRDMTVSVTRTPAQRLARCADVRIEQDGAEAFVLRDLPEPELVATVLAGAIARSPAAEPPEPPRYD